MAGMWTMLSSAASRAVILGWNLYDFSKSSVLASRHEWVFTQTELEHSRLHVTFNARSG